MAIIYLSDLNKTFNNDLPNIMRARRVVITGMGMVSPLGPDLPSSWTSLISNQSGIRQYVNDPVLKNKNPYNLSLVKSEEFEYKKWRVAHASNRMNSFLASATHQALQNARILQQGKEDSINKNRMGICLGVMSSNISKLHQFTTESMASDYVNINRLSMLHILSNVPAGTLNVKYQFYGPSMTVSTACASGLSSIVEAFKWIKLNDADLVLAGGCQDVYNPICLQSSIRLQAMSTKEYQKPEQSSRPFDKDRSGFILGQGCGMLVVEELQHAKKRGANIIAQITGYGCTSDGYHLVRPKQSGQGQINSMELALKMAQQADENRVKIKERISFINVHATSTKAGDQVQANSIKKVFGEQNSLKISAFKGAIGHTFGAAGALESILSIKCLQQGRIAKISNLTNPDVENLNYVTDQYRGDLDYVLKNSFGFGGINISAIFKKYKQ